MASSRWTCFAGRDGERRRRSLAVAMLFEGACLHVSRPTRPSRAYEDSGF